MTRGESDTGDMLGNWAEMLEALPPPVRLYACRRCGVSTSNRFHCKECLARLGSADDSDLDFYATCEVEPWPV